MYLHVEDSGMCFPHERHIAVTPAIRQRGRHPSTIWVFDSPKNNLRFTISGDVAFMHCVLLEGDTTVTSYNPYPAPVQAQVESRTYTTVLDLVVNRADGTTEWWEFKRNKDVSPSPSGRAKIQLAAQAKAASSAGVKYLIKTEKDLRHKELLFDNWLWLCRAMTAARAFSCQQEVQLIHEQLRRHDAFTYGSLLDHPNTDPALIFAATARLLQKGTLVANLEAELFGLNTILHRRPA